MPSLSYTTADEKMIEVMTRIAKDLERAIVGICVCSGLLGFIAFILVVRLILGR